MCYMAADDRETYNQPQGVPSLAPRGPKGSHRLPDQLQRMRMCRHNSVIMVTIMSLKARALYLLHLMLHTAHKSCRSAFGHRVQQNVDINLLHLIIAETCA